MLRIPALIVLCLVSACTQSRAEDGMETTPVILSPARPAMLTPPPAGDIQRLRVRVTEIRNPTAGQLGIKVTLIDPTTGGRQEIGRFAVFPADRTGDHVLAVSDSVKNAFEDPAVSVEFALSADTTDDPGLSVTLRPIWE